MIVVILAGGSGTRLWPLSTNDHPKPLLQLIDNETLIQATYRRVQHLTKDIYFIPEKRLTEDLKKQLPDLPADHLTVEPGLRGTANCVLAALRHIARTHDPDEPIAIMSVDHIIRDVEGFVHSFKVAETISAAMGRIVLIGIEPTYPSTAFGYIQKDGDLDAKGFAYNVLSFKEKPSFEIARKYVQSGRYLWNASYFVASLNTFLRAMEQYAPSLKRDYDRLAKAKDDASYVKMYLSLKKDTIDYALIEKVKGLMVVQASFDWMDVGSFKDLHQVSDHDESGNYTKGPHIELEGVENSYIRNEEDKPLAVIGLDNVVVVNSSNGVLVARTDLSQNVGTIAKKVQGLE